MLLMHGFPAENCPAGGNVNFTSMSSNSNDFQDTFPLIRTNTHSIVLHFLKIPVPKQLIKILYSNISKPLRNKS